MKDELILTNDGVVHAGSWPNPVDRTICGNAMEGFVDEFTDIEDLPPFVEFLRESGNENLIRKDLLDFVPTKITCPECLEALRFYKSIRLPKK